MPRASEEGTGMRLVRAGVCPFRTLFGIGKDGGRGARFSRFSRGALAATTQRIDWPGCCRLHHPTTLILSMSKNGKGTLLQAAGKMQIPRRPVRLATLAQGKLSPRKARMQTTRNDNLKDLTARLKPSPFKSRTGFFHSLFSRAERGGFVAGL